MPALRRYGENTGNSASTYAESMYVTNMKKKKKIILIRSIPFEDDFEYLQGRTFFGMNNLELPWMVGEPMPPDLPDEIIKGMGIKPAVQAPKIDSLDALVASEGVPRHVRPALFCLMRYRGRCQGSRPTRCCT